MPRAANEQTNPAGKRRRGLIKVRQAGRQTDGQWGKVNHSDFRTLTPQLHKPNQDNNNKVSKGSEGKAESPG